MLMVVVAGFVLAMWLTDGSAGPVGGAPWWVLLPGACAYVIMAYGAARWCAAFGLRRLMRRTAGGRLGRGPAFAALATQVYLVAALGGLMLAGWGSWIAQSGAIGSVPLIGKALALLPFAGALLAYWWAIYPLETAMRSRIRAEMALVGQPVLPTWSRGQYLSFNVRHHLLFVAVPAGAMIFVLDLLVLLGPRIGRTAATVAATAAAAGIFLLAPVMIVRIWRTRPLPAGKLRQRLEELCRRVRLRYRDIRVWHTDGAVVNAGVMGLVAPVRYVLLSDGLLEQLDPDTVEAIFAHEAGHVVHQHILHLFVFMGGLVLLCGSSARWLAAWLPTDSVQMLPVLLAAGTPCGWLFGMLSRRFERQADVFGAWWARPGGHDGHQSDSELSAEGVELFGNALLAVARLNGIHPKQRNFRHGSIEKRLEYLAALYRSGRGRAALDRHMRRIKMAIWALPAAGVAAALALWWLGRAGS